MAIGYSPFSKSPNLLRRGSKTGIPEKIHSIICELDDRPLHGVDPDHVGRLNDSWFRGVSLNQHPSSSEPEREPSSRRRGHHIIRAVTHDKLAVMFTRFLDEGPPGRGRSRDIRSSTQSSMKRLFVPSSLYNGNMRIVRPPLIAGFVKLGVMALAILLAVSSPPTGADTSTAHVVKGDALMAKNDLDGAIGEYRRALRMNPRNAQAHYQIGFVMKTKGDLDGAIAEYRQAIRLKPDLALAHANLGSALRVKHDLDGSIAELKEALHINPDMAEAHRDLGFDLGLKRDMDGAIVELREAVRLNPDLVEAHSGLGDALRFKHDLDGAIVEYREAIRINPKYALGHFNLAGVLEEKGKRQEAALEFAEAARLDPNLNLRRAGSRNRRPPLPPH